MDKVSRLFLAVLLGGALGLWSGVTPAGATECDLTTSGSSCTMNGAIYQQMTQQPTGSDQIAFVRMDSNSQPIEQGYNTSFRPVQFNEVTDLTHTHDLLVSNVPVVTIGGATYYQFGLDINQTGSSPLLSMDRLVVFGSNTGMQTNFNWNLGVAPTLGTTSLVYNMGLTNWVLMNYSLNSGSGSGDIWFNLPTALLNGYQYVYLYSYFGDHNANNDGYEEWFIVQHSAPPAVPEPTSLLLMGSGLAGLRFLRRKANRTA